MRLFATALALMMMAACGSTKTPTATPTTEPSVGQCTETSDDSKHLTFGPTGLQGAVLGKGSVGIVMAHQNGGSACQWLPNALELSTQGYRVLIFSFAGFGGSPSGSAGIRSDVEEAVKALRAQGVTKVVLIGASMGGSAVIAAAAAITPPVDAVVSLSAPEVFGQANAGQAAPRLTMPVLYAAGANENTFALSAQAMHDSSKASPDAQLVLAGGSSAHGISLVMPDSGEKKVQEAMAAFLKKYAPTS